MPKFIDLTGQKFNQLTVLYKDVEKTKQTKKTYWVCQCDCGNIKSVYANNLKTNHTQSCGCYQKKQTSNANIHNLIGQRFGNLVVIKQAQNGGAFNVVRWECLCDCGNTTIVYANALTKGFTRSCGCLKGSVGEKNIENILKENNIQFQKEYTIKEIGYLRYDFFLPDLNRFIEYDGEQHYRENSGNWKASSLKERAMRDKIKTDYAKDKNIDLVRIPYWEKDNITLEMIIGNKYLK